jgi:hypothetical protein
MIDIKSLPPKVSSEFRHDPFIFIAANQKQVNIHKFSAIVLKNDVMHVVDVLPRIEYKSGFHPFYLQHTDLFYEAQKLFKALFSHEPDKLIYSYKGDYSTSVFLFTSTVLIEKALKKEVIEIKCDKNIDEVYVKKLLRDEKSLGIEVKNLVVDSGRIHANLPVGVFPVIGALNSIDSGWRTPNFNLIFGSESIKGFKENESLIKVENNIHPKEHQWIWGIDEYFRDHFKRGISLYSIGWLPFKFDSSVFDSYNPFDMSQFYSNAIAKGREAFTEIIIDFLLAINRGTYLPLTTEGFSALMPHFYGFDRLAESVAVYDDREKAKLKYLYDSAASYATTFNPLSCKNIIDYFLRDSEINFDALSIDPGKEILKAFERQPHIPFLIGRRKEILSRFITNGAPNNRYDQFINGADGQIIGKNKVYPLL